MHNVDLKYAKHKKLSAAKQKMRRAFSCVPILFKLLHVVVTPLHNFV